MLVEDEEAGVPDAFVKTCHGPLLAKEQLPDRARSDPPTLLYGRPKLCGKPSRPPCAALAHNFVERILA